MMNFIRKVYYNKENGDVLTSFQASSTGNIHTTIEEDIEIYPELGSDVIERRNIGVLEWVAPDAAIEEQFANAYGIVRVDVSGSEPSIIFRLTPPPAGSDEEIDGRDDTLKLTALRTTIECMCSVLTAKQLIEVGNLCAAQGIRMEAVLKTAVANGATTSQTE